MREPKHFTTTLLCICALLAFGMPSHASTKKLSFSLDPNKAHFETSEPSANQNHKHRKNVLVLNSYHHGFHWTDRILNGVNQVFTEASNVELFYEFMDTKRKADEDYLNIYFELLNNKYSKDKFDAIITTDDHALNFVLNHRDSLFGDIPIAFCGVNDYDPYILKGQKNISGVYEQYSISGTINLIQKLHPEAKDYYLITDGTVSGEAFYNIAKRYNSNTTSDSEIKPHKLHLLHDLDTLSLSIKLHSIPKNAVIIWGIYIQTEKAVFNVYESIRFVKKHSNLPIYCLWDVVGYGVAGGKVTNPENQGIAAAEIIDNILHNPEAVIPTVQGCKLVDKFDYEVLQTLNINLSNLPEQRILLNEPFSLWKHYKFKIIVIALFIVALVFLVFRLVQLNIHTKKKEALIRNRNEKLAQLSYALKKSNKDLDEARQAAETNNKLKSAFLANMSHEIRTPMNGIMGFANLLEKPNLEDKKRKEYIEIIRRSGERMLSTVNDIIEISKIQAEQTQVHLKEVFLTKELNDLKTFFQKEAEDKGIYLRFINELNQDAMLQTDIVKFNSIVTNLIKNALKFTFKGGITLTIFQRHERYQIEVKDTGIGIPKDRLEAIFEPFVQADLNDELALQGSGLGLSIAKSYAELLGGELIVSSTEGNGSTFTFLLPQNTTIMNKPHQQNYADEKPLIDHKIKILVAEDDQFSFEFLQVMLEPISAQTLHAKDGLEAIDLALNNPDIDLILMDIKLPKLNGYEATKQIRAHYPNTIIIAQTAYAMQSDQKKAIEAGCNGYISKPIDTNKLFEIIQQLCV